LWTSTHVTKLMHLPLSVPKFNITGSPSHSTPTFDPGAYLLLASDSTVLAATGRKGTNFKQAHARIHE
jgi:hypothetical protein